MSVPDGVIVKILVINADCLNRNSSANLCHLAYIRGLVELGHQVVVLSADGKDYNVDACMELPECVENHTIYAVSLYEKLSLKKKRGKEQREGDRDRKLVSVANVASDSPVTKIKKKILTLYGVHGIYSTFERRAQKYRDERDYNLIISVSTPAASHSTAERLLKSGKIKTLRWLQIWEDPWYSDAYGLNRDKKIFEEEKRLLSAADKVCYVSPLTLLNQRKLYPESAEKMYWNPLPSYYDYDVKADEEEAVGRKTYGYFGDYMPEARDLRPFYEAALKTGADVNLCGNPSDLFKETEHIRIYARMPLERLRPIEDRTHVLVFLCNLRGGQIPGKIYQYSATSKTILFILDGTEEEKKILADYFGQFHRYVFCENTVEDISRAIRDIEHGNLHGAINRPLDCFAPRKIAADILRGAEAKS